MSTEPLNRERPNVASPTKDAVSLDSALARADEFSTDGNVQAAVEVYQQIARCMEPTPADLCMKIGRCHQKLKNFPAARRWAAAVVEATDDLCSWQSALRLIERCGRQDSQSKRQIRVALLGSFTTAQLSWMLKLACLRWGIDVDLYESPFAQYRQEIINPQSTLYAFSPDVVILAVHDRELGLPEHSSFPDEDVERESSRWSELWQILMTRCAARIVQFNFATPSEVAFGHLSCRLPGSRHAMIQSVNARLGALAASNIMIVDCERLSSLLGKWKWFDSRYWHLAKQAVSLTALPLLARHIAAIIAADLGLSRKCLVLDLDNTLWGGVIGEDGLSGIRLGQGVDGEAYSMFQEFILQLKRKGIILAVCSKNNEVDAKEPFLQHPEMRIRLDDIALFVANWKPKPENLRLIAATLNIGLDSLVFLDDNPSERAAVRQALPEVDIVILPTDPALYTQALSKYLGFETSWYTAEDANRSGQYIASARAAELKSSARSMDEFYRSLHMEAVLAPFDEMNLPRIAQLIAKTNQFNLTTRRHGLTELRAFLQNPDCVHFYVRLKDHFADHGLIGVVLAIRRDDQLEIDTLLMSCRVIGRTVEAAMLQRLCKEAHHLGCEWITGTYLPTAKNDLVRELLPSFGFTQVDDHGGGSKWIYNLRLQGSISNQFVTVTESAEILA